VASRSESGAPGHAAVDLGPPSWSPDGRTIAFIGRSGKADADIYTVHADGTGLRKLTHWPGSSLGPEWSPDGRHIVFLSSRDDPRPPHRRPFRDQR